MIKVLFVCMGNICRSPTAEGIFRKLVEEKGWKSHFYIDSAGTHGHRESPDPRTIETALQRGVDLRSLQGRPIEDSDFEEFDYICAMDKSNIMHLKMMAPQKFHEKITLLLSYANVKIEEVPDPYAGGLHGFENVYDLIQAGSAGLLSYLIKMHHLAKEKNPLT